MRFKFHIFDVYFAAVLLSAILSGAFSFALFKSNLQTSATMVYCPLTKKLQPINPPPAESIAPIYLLNEICAADLEKSRLATAISEYSKLKFNAFNPNNFEDLAFDFWQKGKAALDNLPNTPNAPEKSAAKNSFSSIGLGGDFNFKFVWKTSEKFAFQIQPRPPTTPAFPAFNSEFSLKLDQISRRLAPRAPPVFV